jgi:hypothetical protein
LAALLFETGISFFWNWVKQAVFMLANALFSMSCVFHPAGETEVKHP